MNVPLRVIWIRVVSDIGEEQDRAVVIGTEGDVIYRPEPKAGCILTETGVEVSSDWWSGVSGDGIPGNCESKIVLLNH